MNSGSIFLCLHFEEKFVNKKKMLPELLAHSVWHFLTFVTIKIVGEPKQQTLILATNEVIESRCVQSCYSLLYTISAKK